MGTELCPEPRSPDFNSALFQQTTLTLFIKSELEKVLERIQGLKKSAIIFAIEKDSLQAKGKPSKRFAKPPVEVIVCLNL